MTGNRGSWPAALLLVGFLLAAPKAFVLGPLALLLLLSRPVRMAEWFWIGASAALALVMLNAPATLVDRTVRAAGVCFTGAFVMMSLIGVRSLFRRTLLAVIAAAGAVATWFAMLGLRWTELRDALVDTQWVVYRLFFPQLPEVPPQGTAIGQGQSAQFAAELGRGLVTTVDLWPASQAILALGGGFLAWRWYHRIASSPIGVPARPFRDFTFPDPYIWLVIVAGALALAPLPAGWSLLARNVVVFLLAVYAGRGLAVIQTALVPAPTAMAVLLSVAALFLLPLALVVATLVGLADTWLDLRRRMAPPEGALQ
ncbi:MAG TPA: DUF2232 domain-containing protein [Gemmatimonadales bacterium]|nr:DUF2232 domain-containing protein [Gemmatimonadales bacterium]